MNHANLIIATTAGAAWQGAINLSGPVSAICPLDSPAMHAAASAETPMLIVVEAPTIGLARLLTEAANPEPLQWLALWRDSARALARQVRARPRQVLAIDAEDLARCPQAVCALVVERLHAELLSDVSQMPPAVGALARCLADTLCVADADTLDLYAELSASCWPVGKPSTRDKEIFGLGQVQWAPGEAAQELSQLMRVATQSDHLIAALDQLRREADARQVQADAIRQQLTDLAAEHESSKQRAVDLEKQLCEARASAESKADVNLTRLTSALAGAEADRDAARQAVAAAQSAAVEHQQEFGRLLAALHQVQEELERVHLKAVADRERATGELAAERGKTQAALTERDDKIAFLRAEVKRARTESGESRTDVDVVHSGLALAQAKAGAVQPQIAQETKARQEDLRRHQAESERAAAELSALREELDRLTSGHASLEAALSAARAELQADAERGRQARDEAAELLVHLHEVQTRLEDQHALNRSLNTRIDEMAAEAAKAPPYRGPSWTIVAERDTLPYRELSLVADRWVVGERSVDGCPVRLVEHHGHPGLVFFKPASKVHPLPSWQESGVEGDMPYLRLLPGDPNCRLILDAMNSTEWQALDELVRGMRHHLESAVEAGLSPRWAATCRRLHDALLGMPARARIDRVEVAKHETGSVHVQLHGFSCGTRRLARLALEWQPRGRGAGVSLLADPLTGPLLPFWPVDAMGQSAPCLTLPIGPDVATSVKRARWRSLPPGDRAVLLAILEAMPTWLAKAGEAVPAASEDSRLATALASDARACCGQPGGLPSTRAVLRRAARLLGTPAAA